METATEDYSRMVNTGQRLRLITWKATPALKLSYQYEVLRVPSTMRSASTRWASSRMPSAATQFSRTHSGSHHSRAASGTRFLSALVNRSFSSWSFI